MSMRASALESFCLLIFEILFSCTLVVERDRGARLMDVLLKEVPGVPCPDLSTRES